MDRPDADRSFAGSIPQIYERTLVPLIFEPYAADLAARVAQRRPSRVLEVAAGTGVVTRRLADLLPRAAAIVATDLNQAMLDLASAVGTSRPVEWRRADAMRLPYADGAFDVVVCQFGAMFFPDRAKAFSEARRVLRSGGALIFNVWDRIEHNELADCVTLAVADLFKADPPLFLARVPHGYHDTGLIAADLKRGGFTGLPAFATLPARSRAPSARDPAVGYCQGTPLRNEIEAREAARLDDVTAAAQEAVRSRFGAGPIDAKMQAHVVVVER